MPELLWLQILFIVIFLITGALKLLRHPHMVEEFDKFAYPYSLAYFAGGCEVLAVALLGLGLVYPFLTAMGALLLAAVMLCASYVNFEKRPARFGWGVLPVVALCLWLAYEYWAPFSALFENVNAELM